MVMWNGEGHLPETVRGLEQPEFWLHRGTRCGWCFQCRPLLKGCRMGLRRPSPVFFFVACGLSRDICNSEKERERREGGHWGGPVGAAWGHSGNREQGQMHDVPHTAPHTVPHVLRASGPRDCP